LFPAGQTGDPVLFRDLGRFGIFYRRGCRGHIEALSIYLKNTDTVEHGVNFALKENPDGGIVIDNIWVSQAPGTTGWVTVLVKRYWNYDSLFIYNKDPYSSALQIGYWDTGEEDGFYMYPEERWYVDWQRSAYRVKISALSIGDLPISGTVSSILVPSSSIGVASDIITVTPGVVETVLDLRGQGRNLHTTLRTNNYDLTWQVLVDDSPIAVGANESWSIKMLFGEFTGLFGGVGINVTKYDTTYDYYACMITIPFEFKERLKITVYHPVTTGIVASASCNYIRMA